MRTLRMRVVLLCTLRARAMNVYRTTRCLHRPVFSLQSMAQLGLLHGGSGDASVRKPIVHVSTRQLHATWSILLNHYWLYKKTSSSQTLTKKVPFEETDLPCENVPTVLFLHDAFADLQQGRALAEAVITASGGQKPTIQCLLVDLRGSGGSDADDYNEPHNIEAATEDVLDLVQAICTAPYVPQPSMLVAYGALGSAVARCYAEKTLAKGALTKASHSEISGAGAVEPPCLILTLPGAGDTSDASAFTFDAAVAGELARAAQKFSTAYTDVSLVDCADNSAAVDKIVSFMPKS